MLQKSTELGVDEFAPLITRYSEIFVSETKLASRMERWRRILREAAKQCRRRSIPRIRQPERFESFLNSGQDRHIPKLILDEKASTSHGLRIPDSNQVLLCIGPEGGWDRQEVEDAVSAGYDVFSLGDRILRSETAAIAAVSIVHYLAGGLGKGVSSPSSQPPK